MNLKSFTYYLVFYFYRKINIPSKTIFFHFYKIRMNSLNNYKNVCEYVLFLKMFNYLLHIKRLRLVNFMRQCNEIIFFYESNHLGP